MTGPTDSEALKANLSQALYTLGSAEAVRAAFADASSGLNQIMLTEGYARASAQDQALDLDQNGSIDAELFAYTKEGQAVALTLDHREPLRTASMAELKQTDRLDNVMGNVYALYQGAEALMDQASSADTAEAQHAARRDMVAMTNMLNVMRVQLAAALPETAAASRHLNDVVLVADELVRYVQSDGDVLEVNIWGGAFTPKPEDPRPDTDPEPQKTSKI